MADPVEQLVGRLVDAHASTGVVSVTWLNHWSAQRVLEEPAFRAAAATMTYVGIDGVALKRLLRGTPQRTSADLVVPALLPQLRGARIAVVGADAETNHRAAERLVAMAPHATLVAAIDGYDSLPRSDAQIRECLGSVDPTVVLVGLGAGRQEEFAAATAACLPRGLVLTCGGFLDQVVQDQYYPAWAYPLRLNWAVRLAREPRRLWRRYTVDFVSAVQRRRELQAGISGLPGYRRYVDVVDVGDA